MIRYMQAFLEQVLVSGACNSFNTPETATGALAVDDA